MGIHFESYLSVPEWLKLPLEIRLKLAEIFEIPKSKGAQVEVQGAHTIIQSDGYTHDDLQAITIQKMQELLNSRSTDFVLLFNAVIAKLEEDKELEVEPQPDPKELILEEWVAILNRLREQAVENQMEMELTLLVKRTFHYEPQQVQAVPAKRGRPKKVKSR